jgi:hypothetical protein
MRSTNCLLRLCALALSISACDQPVIYVSVGDVPQDCVDLRVRVQLNGQPIQDDVARFKSDLGRFSVRLPSIARGSLRVAVECFSADGCRMAQGSGTLNVERDGQLGLSVPLSALSSPECPALRVRKTSDGDKVVSDPSGIDCGPRCEYSFPVGTVVRLHVEDSVGSFHGFGGPCSGLGDCQLTTAALTPEVQLSFGRKHCEPSGYCWESPLPHGDAMAVGGAAGQLFAVGRKGAALRWDGALWQPMRTESSADLYAVGGWAPPDGRALYFAVGDNGTILRLEQNGFTLNHSGGPTLRAIFVAGPQEAYAAGDGGTILRWDGARWTAMASGTSSVLYAIAGLRASGDHPTNLFAAGERGVLLRLLGNNWEKQTSGTQAQLSAIRGVSGVDGRREVFVVGGDEIEPGIMLHWDGYRWQRQPSHSGLFLRGIYGETVTDLTAVGGGQFPSSATGMLRYNGSEWQMLMQDGVPDSGLASDERGQLIGITRYGTLLRFTGQAWISMNSQLPMFEAGILFGGGENRIFDAERHGIILERGGQTWRAGKTALDTPTAGCVLGDRLAFLAGQSGDVLRWDGTSWKPLPLPTLYGRSVDLTPLAMGGVDERSLMIGGIDLDEGTSIWRWNGATFAKTPIEGSPNSSISGLHVVAPDDAYATAWLGNHGDPNYENLILHWDGNKWKVIYRNPDDEVELQAVFGIGASDIFVAGRPRLVLRKSGSTWLPMDIEGAPENLGIYSISGKSTNSLFAAGSDHYVLKYDGVKWRATQPPGPLTWFSSVYSPAPGRAYFHALGGHILVYSEPRR